MKRSLTATLLVLVALILGLPAQAQNNLPYPGAVTMITRDFDPANPGKSILKPVFGDPKLMRQVVNTAWQAARASIADQIIAQMGQANSVADGITPYNIDCRMGEPGDLSVTPGSHANGSTLNMKYMVRGNWIEFDTTQPTALGKWADPRFSCTYDLELSLGLTFGDMPGPLRMTSVKAQVSNSKLDSHGLIADLVFVGNAVTKLFGTDFIKKAQNAINGKNFDFTNKINQGLAPFNAVLAGYGAQGYGLANSLLNLPDATLPGGLSPRSLPGMNRGNPGPQLVLFLDKDGNIPTRGPGEIWGAIRWKKTLGTPQEVRRDRQPVIAPGYKALGRVRNLHPYAGAFRIRAVAQSGFGRSGMFVPPMSEVGVLKSATLDQPTPGRDNSAPGTGDEYVLRYVIAQVPLGIPIKVEVTMNGVPWQGDVGGMQRAIGPSGWSGLVTLKPGLNLGSAVTKTSNISAALRATGARSGASRARAGSEKSIIIVSGKGATTPGAEKSIIIVSGTGANPIRKSPALPVFTPRNNSDAVALNPQPLPPKTMAGAKATIGALSSTQTATVRSNVRRSGPVNYDLGTTATAVTDIGTPAILAHLPKPVAENPTGRLSVDGIDFEVGLIAGPR
ncbi:MAG TPA: hypothetical protein VF600_16595 [Abditibacteriaceae bacterium]